MDVLDQHGAVISRQVRARSATHRFADPAPLSDVYEARDLDVEAAVFACLDDVRPVLEAIEAICNGGLGADGTDLYETKLARITTAYRLWLRSMS